MKLTLMLPAFNEEQDLPGLLHRIKDALANWADYRVLIVDDGSQDRTAAIVREAARWMPVTLIQHPHNMGLGAAIRTGLKAAASLDGTVVTLDADNSQDPELIRRMVETVALGADVVIASRFQPGAREVGVPAHRLVLSHVSSAGIRLLVRYPGARDYTCGFRAYRVETLRRLVDRYGDNFVRENGFSCMLELLLNFRRIGAKVAEVPLVLRYDLKVGASKMRIFRTMWRYVVTLTRGFLPLAKRGESAAAAALRETALAEARRPVPSDGIGQPPAKLHGL
jgi:dolichol-phosphate mannosyltransferase